MAPSNHGSDGHYEPEDAIGATIKTTAITFGAGGLLAAAQTSLTKQNIGAFGIFTRYGNTVAMFTVGGASYQFVKSVSANLRQKKDHWNNALGGFAAGAAVGAFRRTIPAIIGSATASAVWMGGYEYLTGGNLFNPQPLGEAIDREEDQVEKYNKIMNNYRRPIEETISELGEGRGIKAPGYEERRRQRIKERYGVDIDPVPVQ
ncbi:NADH-ubiquinone oxidoreductase 213 kDa subunit [Eremomyces bilateralis CBS 781.70]|uniref:NADH-ubiquinone oxidoreductase 213 kDa subunit n=1 Tax=Eremomyces bilateralis CBS 781.70 TaxID=1392243 RepID=A0A6G1GIE5_9PEZI|nr:NADH-ubiquinone oxidoreductase 213 kDa subunit [Eremomyces bilateralis CBS 781.70]KAF1817659.1 NADH-ubiquinone oxidoreductase 213 kDa subunit [Eremomyces bilateralis CBS 781.70]